MNNGPVQTQDNIDSMGLPVLDDGGLDPTGGVGTVRSGRVGGVQAYGAAGTMFNTNEQATNPLFSDVVVRVRDACRTRFNEYLRMEGLPLLQKHEEPPALLMLIELREYTQEPLQTFARRNMKGMTVRMATSQAITVKWARIPYKAVPYEVREFPIWVANALLDQIKHFVVVPVYDSETRKFYGVQIPDERKVQIAMAKFRNPHKGETEKDFMKGARTKTTVPIGGQGKSVMLAMNPEGGESKLVDVGGAKVVDADGRESYVNLNQKVNPDIPPVGGSTQQAPQRETPQTEDVALPSQPDRPQSDGSEGFNMAPSQEATQSKAPVQNDAR